MTRPSRNVSVADAAMAVSSENGCQVNAACAPAIGSVSVPPLIINAVVYAPTPMKPACASVSCPA
jgi:hypothetical protein